MVSQNKHAFSVSDNRLNMMYRENTAIGRELYTEGDPRYYTAQVKNLLEEAIKQLREDVPKVHEPKAKALLDTTTEVLKGLVAAYDHYEGRTQEV
jgi:hypothetical protein